MCNLLTVSNRKKIKGYKVVAKKLKGKRYFSIAMGFKYPLDGHIPAVRKQRSICSDFTDNIISKDSVTRSEKMVGRTALFLNFKSLYESMHVAHWTYSVKKGYKLVIVQVETSTDIMEGYYGIEDYPVAAGRHIRFIKEIQELN